jgi:molecular chaperone DnaJ
MFCLFGTLLAFVAIGQLGLWASQVANPGALEGLTVLEPIMFVPYTLIGLIAAYFTFRYAGYAGLALAFVAMLVVGQRGGPGGSGQPENLLQFGALGMFLLLAVIYFGKRRDDNARRR